MEQIDLRLIQSDRTVKKQVLEVYGYLKIYKEADDRIKWMKRRDGAWDIIENKLWTAEEEKEIKNQGMVPLKINKCVKGVQGSSAVVTDQKPDVKFYPVGSGDLYIAELFKRGFDVVWEKNEGNDQVYDAVEERNIGGMPWMSVVLDKSLTPFGSIVFEEEPPEDFYFDKESRKRDYSDTHIIKAKMRNRQYIEDRYPGIKSEDLYFMPTSVEDDSFSSGVTGGDNYAEQEDNQDTLDPEVVARQKIIWEIEAWMLKTVHEDWFFELDKNGEPAAKKMSLKKDQKATDVLKEGEQHYWPRKVKKRVQLIIVGKHIVSEKVNPEGEDSDGHPVMTLLGMKAQKTRNAYSMSPTMYAADLQKEKIKRRMQAIHSASHLSNAPVVRPEDSKWKGGPSTPGSELIVGKNSAFAPFRLQSGAADVMKFIALEERSDNEIDDVYDMQDVMKGKVPKGSERTSGRMVLALQDAAGMMSKPSLRRLESFLVRLAKVIMAMMLSHWQRYMWERLLEDTERVKFAPDGSDEAMARENIPEEERDPDFEDLLRLDIAMKWEAALEKIRPRDINKPPGFRLLDIDVKITAGSSMPTNRIAKEQLAMEKVQAGVYDAEAALEYTDDPQKDKVIARLKKRQEAEMQAGVKK